MRRRNIVGPALVVAARRKERRPRMVALGIALHLLYTIVVGGDFMYGRFFAAPMFGRRWLLAGCGGLPIRAGVLLPLPLLSPFSSTGTPWSWLRSQLRLFYDHLSTVIRGDLDAPSRWREIWRFVSGAYQPWLDASSRSSTAG